MPLVSRQKRSIRPSEERQSRDPSRAFGRRWMREGRLRRLRQKGVERWCGGWGYKENCRQKRRPQKTLKGGKEEKPTGGGAKSPGPASEPRQRRNRHPRTTAKTQSSP